MSDWIKFVERAPIIGRKTRRWAVLTADGNTCLGAVGWYSSWRKYTFMSNEGTIFEQDCLREIAAFIEDQTYRHNDEE